MHNEAVIKSLRLMVRGAYSLQKLRIQTGLRLCANFRERLKQPEIEEAEIDDAEKLNEKAVKIIDTLKESYRRLTDGVARNRTLPKEQGFVGDGVVSDYTELVLIDQYLSLERLEAQQFRHMTLALEKLPIYNNYLKKVDGIGSAMAAVLVTYFDIEMAVRPSQFWGVAGLDVGPDNRARSRRAEHLVERTYVKSDGSVGTKMSVTFNPWLQSAMMGRLAPCFIRAGGHYKKVYADYKHRILTDPARLKATPAEMLKHKASGEDLNKYWPPMRVHHASMRYAVKMFLKDFWYAWRGIENLPIVPSYHEAVLGHTHHAELPTG